MKTKKLTEKIRWLLLLRVVILSFFLGATALFHFFGTEGDVAYLDQSLHPADPRLRHIDCFGRYLGQSKDLAPFAHAQVCFDVILITGIIWITGDIASPFSVLYNLAVMNGAILLFYRGAFFTAACSSLSYSGLLLWSRFLNSGQGTPLTWSTLIPIVLSISSFFVIAWLGGFLANKLSETEQLLKEKQIDYQELDAFKDALLQGIGSGVAITDPDGPNQLFQSAGASADHAR